MTDLSKPWPLGLGEKRWWIAFAGVVVALGVAFLVDRQVSLFVQGWPAGIRTVIDQFTPYGESAWILWPSGVLYLVTAAVALVVRWKLMRTMLWQFAALYAFIFTGVAAPSLFTTIVKRLIGRGRPMHYDDTGLFGLKFNVADWTYQSFPSGHSTTAFALAAVLGFLSPRWFYPVLLLAAMIGLSRLTLGVHYPSDVLAGAVVGLVGAYAVRLAFADRRWMFVRSADGRIHGRPLSSLKRYLTLKKRGIAPVRPTSQP